jgi:hypothetical protein
MPVLAQPLAKMLQGIGNAIDFRRKRLGNNANVLALPVAWRESGHNASCRFYGHGLTMKNGRDSNATA